MKAPTSTTQPAPTTEAASEELWSEDTVTRVCDFGRTTLRSLARKGQFPAPIMIGEMRASGRPGRVAWLKSEVLGWIDQQARTARVEWAKKPADAGAQASA